MPGGPTRHALTTGADFPVSMWDDPDDRENGCWGSLRFNAESMAKAENRTLDGEIDRSVLFMRTVDATGTGEPADVECTREQAEFVRLFLRMWATGAVGEHT